MSDLKQLLDSAYLERNTILELDSAAKPDPIIALKKYENAELFAEIAIICALLSYGNAAQILKTLNAIDFSILKNKNDILKYPFPKYRFQTSDDIKALFLALNSLIQKNSIKKIFVESYKKNHSIIDGINALIYALNSRIQTRTNGINFLIGKVVSKKIGASPLKRWNLALRWLVRRDNIDFGIWGDCVNKSDLILPLDTHTFATSRKLGLLNRKIYDLQSAFLITQKLKEFCPEDPIKYDFALYRIGQEKMLYNFIKKG